MNTRFAKQVIAVTAFSLLGTQALAANTESLPEERRGVVIGGIIGASVGGPIGAGAGAILGGGVFGKLVGAHRINNELKEEVASLEQQNRSAAAEMKREIAQLTRSLDKARSGPATVQTQPELPIQFRTASVEIEPHYQSQLAEVARAVAAYPEAKVRLSGFADRRGDETYNQQLSEDRVAEVKAFLQKHGVSGKQIETRAFGESAPVKVEQNPENDFFDRRVVMTLTVDADDSVASR